MALVGHGNHPLLGVVNNAGVVGVAPLIEMSEQELNFVLNVNLLGPYRITKAFAPLVLATKGRVINISSLNGIVASPMIGAYSMSCTWNRSVQRRVRRRAGAVRGTGESDRAR